MKKDFSGNSPKQMSSQHTEIGLDIIQINRIHRSNLDTKKSNQNNQNIRGSQRSAAVRSQQQHTNLAQEHKHKKNVFEVSPGILQRHQNNIQRTQASKKRDHLCRRNGGRTLVEKALKTSILYNEAHAFGILFLRYGARFHVQQDSSYLKNMFY